uniref:RNase H type-1 domain-containing protein n=1 Tax=Fagus sylvatica TaxID=28930 RepID=A0A2N9G6S6_FAGSY
MESSKSKARADYWLPTPPGIYKINLHISFSSPRSCVCRGFIIRDDKGLVTAAVSSSKQGCGDLTFAKEIGLSEVVLEVASKALAKALPEHVEDDSTSNKAARRLAQEAKTPISFDVWLEDYPVLLRDFV